MSQPMKSNSQNKMTAWGVGPRLLSILLPYLAIAIVLHIILPNVMLITHKHNIIFPIMGIILIAFGFIMWALGGRIIHKAFNEGKLLTNGVYGIVRHPIYSGVIVFISPGIALWLRSWSLLSVPVVAYIVFRFLIKKEDKYLEEKFGQEFLDYKSKVNALIPFFRFTK